MTTSPHQHHRLLKFATYASVTTATVLIITKLVAWILTDSVSLLATLLDSTMDALASLITLFVVRIALMPADKQHPFGHGKAEYLAVLAQAAFIAGSALMLLLNCFDRFNDDVTVVHGQVGMAVMLFSMLATVILLIIQRHVVRVTGSSAIASDALHYRTDLLTNLAVMIALWGAELGYPQMDTWLAVGIALYMLFTVFGLAKEAIDNLMDHSLPESDVQKIGEIICAVPGVLNFHDLRTRISGYVPFIQLHLELPYDYTLEAAHAIAAKAKHQLLKHFPNGDIIIHLDPRGRPDLQNTCLDHSR